MSGKPRSETRYEREIKISLFLLILFLFLMNCISTFLFYNSQSALRSEFNQKLDLVVKSVRAVFKLNPVREAFSLNLRELTSFNQVSRIDVYGPGGKFYGSSTALPLQDSLRLITLAELSLLNASRPPWQSQISKNENGQSILDYSFSLPDGEQGKFWAVLRVNAQPLVSLEKSSRLAFWILASGFLAAMVVTFYLLRSALQPYQAIKREALQANLLSLNKARPGTDLVVETFKNTIAELREKEAILREMYSQKSRQAQDLSRLNEYILSGMQSGVIICNPQGEITKVNQAAGEILSVSESQLLGKKFFDYFGPQTQLAQLVEKALLERKTSLGQEIEFASPQQKVLNLEVNTSLIEDETKNLLGVTILFSDLSELKKLREELVFKEKMAVVGEMTAGLAHQLRNSMGSVYGFANLLKKSIGQPQELNQIIDQIARQTESLEALLEKFLDFSKPLQIQFQRVDFEQILSESYQTAWQAKPFRSSTFEVRVAQNLPPFSGDRLLLKQCFQNLFQNALEAMPDGGKLKVEVTGRESQAGSPQIVIEVTDSGTGMTEKEMLKVFEPFYSTKSDGTGLGLSLVKKIINQHGGKIAVESKRNQGTIFTIFLPAGELPVSERASPTANLSLA